MKYHFSEVFSRAILKKWRSSASKQLTISLIDNLVAEPQFRIFTDHAVSLTFFAAVGVAMLLLLGWLGCTVNGNFDALRCCDLLGNLQF